MQYLAIHLPQFHPIKENDAWWGNGFTEWTNAVRARPLFRGHYQPHLPADLGFYDLRVPEARVAQAELAKEYAIDGFCYYHYWFHGRRVLERPVDEIAQSGRPDFPFCLFWANESWEGRWHGLTGGQSALIRQEYSEQDDLEHIRWIASLMADRRYFRVEGRPLFLIFRPLGLPDCARTLDAWRNEVLRLGLPNPFFIASDAHAPETNFLDYGFDGVMQHLPRLYSLDCLETRDLGHRLRRLCANLKQGILSSDLHVYDYEDSVRKMFAKPDWPVFRSIIPSWDNTPRMGRDGVILKNSTPEKFRNLLREISEQAVLEQPAGRRLVFINAWNEWAEGNHLEPDQKHGLAYLEAVRRAKSQSGGSPKNE